MKYKKYLRVFSVSIFAISALMIGSVNSANAGFWDWFGLGGGSQQAQVNTTTYKWVNNGLVSESSGRNTGTCAKAQTTTYTCSSSNVGAKLYDGTNRGSSYGDVGHAWPIYEGVNTSVATEYTYSGCGLDKRTGGQVNQWECKAVNTTTNSSTSSAIPTVQTIQPSNITTTSATLKGIVDPKDKTSKTYFEIFPDPNGGSYGMMTPQQTAVNYYGVQEFSFNLTNLKPGTTYTYYAYVSYYDSTTGTNKVIKDTVGKTVTTSFESNSNPIISVTSPNGGEIFKQGDVMTVSWKSTGIIPVDAWVGRIALYNNNGASFLIDLVPFLSKWPTSGSIQWLIPNNSVIGSDFKVQTILYKGVVGNESVISSDFSNASFTIASGSSSSSSSTAIPTVQTTYADNITSNYASLFGTVDTKDKSGKVYFEIFPDPNGGSYGMMTPQQSLPSSYVGSFGADVSNLKPGTVYKYYAVFTYYDSSTGNNKIIKDAVGKTFTTLSSSSSSTSNGLTAITDPVELTSRYDNVNLMGTINNPNNESFYYYFNYRKETESSEQTKRSSSSRIDNSPLSLKVSAGVVDLSPNTKYVYRLYAYSYTTGKTVSGELKSFTTQGFSSSSSTSGNLPPVITAVSGPTNLKINEQGIWTVKANDPENGYLSYDVCWGSQDFDRLTGDGCSRLEKFTQIHDTTATFSYSYSKIGSYAPIFTVTDNKGQSTKTSVSVNVGLQAYPQTTIINPYQTNSVEQASSYVFTRELGYGSSGNDVTELQKRLTSEGYYFGPITGYYGSMTVEAVKKYQSNNGIPVTGYVGPQTLSVLNGSGVRSTSSSSGSSQGTSLSQLVELFIALGIISPDKADLARASVKGM